MGGDIPREVLEDAAAAVRERVREDEGCFEAPTREFVAYVDEHLFSPRLTVTSALDAARMQSHSVRDRFRYLTGLSPTAYVLECRMEVALRLLQRLPDVSIHQIAHALGYEENTFHNAFRRFYGGTAHQTRLKMQAHPELLEMPPALHRCEKLERLDWGRLSEGEHAAFRRVFEAQSAPPWESGEMIVAEDPESFEERFFNEVMEERLATASPIEQSELVRNGFPFKSVLLPQAYMHWSREGCRDDRKQGVRVAEAAVDSVWALRTELGSLEFSLLLAEAQANLGNARRLVFDYEGAERAFAEAEAVLVKHPAPAELESKVLWLEGTLRQFQRRLSEAQELLSRSLSKATEPVSRARVLLTRGIVHELQGDKLSAECDYLEAQGQLESGSDAYLQISAHLCLGVLCARRGDHHRAESELEEARRWAPAVGSRRVDLHLSWVEGLFRQARGQEELARRRLREAREGFLDLDDPVFVALVSLDLALLLGDHGRMAEVEQLMAEALPYFEKVRFDAEGRAALRLLQRAAARRQITTALLAQVRSHLELAGLVPRRP